MTTTLALENLYTKVISDFTAWNINAVHAFGWRELAKHVTGIPRIVWVPGDPGANAGTSVAPRFPGQIPRAISNLRELFTVYITSFDRTDQENELQSYRMARLLRDAWVRSVYLAAHGTFAIRAESWVTDKLVRRYGATIRLVCEVEAVVLDEVPDEIVTSGDTESQVDAVAKAHETSEVLTAEIAVDGEDDPDIIPGS